MADPPIPEPYAPLPPQLGRPAPAESLPAPRPLPQPDPQQFFFSGPVLNPNPQAVAVPPAAPAAIDRPLPINLATALYLSNARPLVIAFAQNSVELAAAQLQRAKVMWLPNLNTGVDYYHHEGSDQSTNGQMMGYPARSVICDRPVGELQNVDTSRPPSMSPVSPQVISRP
jgi:hypothetical protein